MQDILSICSVNGRNLKIIVLGYIPGNKFVRICVQ